MLTNAQRPIAAAQNLPEQLGRPLLAWWRWHEGAGGRGRQVGKGPALRCKSLCGDLEVVASKTKLMKTVALPSWNALGLIPPIDEQQPTSAERSPYAVSLTDFVLRFGQTQPRRVVLGGFLKYRPDSTRLV